MGERSEKDETGRWTGWLPIAIVLAASAAAWGLLFLAIPAREQNFPLIDDWAYARQFLWFAREHRIHYGNFGLVPELGLWLYALPVAWMPDELIHVCLRLSTIALSLVGLVALYDLVRRHPGLAPVPAALVVAGLAFNPYFFILQGTFMTDVPTLSFSLIALALYSRAIALGNDSRGRLVLLVAASAVACLAAMTRQNTVIVPVVAGMLMWWSGKRHCVLMRLVGVGLPILVAVGTSMWFHARPDTEPSYYEVPKPDVIVLFPFAALQLLGLLTLPIWPLAAVAGKWKWVIAAVVLMLAGAWYWGQESQYLPYGEWGFPYLCNTIGPHGIEDAPMLVGERPVLLSGTMRQVLTILGCLGGGVLAVRLAVCFQTGLWRHPVILFGLLQLPLILMLHSVNDRYFLFLVPGALVALCAGVRVSRPRWVISAGLVVAVAAFSVALEHDFLAWNRARWALGRRAVRNGVAALDIEGGFEWDGWHGPETLPPPKTRLPQGLALPFTRWRLPFVNGKYTLSFSPLPETVELDREPYSQWLIPGEWRYYLLGQDGAQPPRQ
jgi:hypothetical protein